MSQYGINIWSRSNFVRAFGGLFVAFSLSQFSYAQDFEEDFGEIGKAYQLASGYSLEMTYSLYATYESSEVLESQTASIKKRGANYFSDMFGLETVINDNYVVVVDHESKTLMIDYPHNKVKDFPIEISVDVDSLIADLEKIWKDVDPMVEKIVHTDLGKGRAAYTIHYNQGDFSRLKIYFNKTTYLISRVVMYHALPLPILEDAEPASPRIEIAYKKFNQKPLFTEATFSERKYVMVGKAGKLNLKPQYADYTVINHLLERPKGRYDQNN